MDILLRALTPPAMYRAAQHWEWLGVHPRMTPVVGNHFGDLFLEDDAGVWYLDPVVGTLEMPWPSREAFFAALRDPETQQRYLCLDRLRAVVLAGIERGDDEVLVPLVPRRSHESRRKIEPADLRAMSLEEAHHYFSQIHEQYRDRPAGHGIHGISRHEDGTVELSLGPLKGQEPTGPPASMELRRSIDHALTRASGSQPGWATPPDGLSIFRHPEGVAGVRTARGHWHLVTYALSSGNVRCRTAPHDLVELSLVAEDDGHAQPPAWALTALVQTADNIRRGGRRPGILELNRLPGFLADTGFHRAWPVETLVPDPDLPTITTPSGPITLLRIIALSEDGADAVDAGNTSVQALVDRQQGFDRDRPTRPTLLLPTTVPEFDWDVPQPPVVQAPNEWPTLLLRPAVGLDHHQVLSHWTWVGLTASDLVLGVSWFGDLFVESADEVCFLDMVTGRIGHSWSSERAMLADLQSPANQERFLRASFVARVQARGLRPAAGQVLFPVPPPALSSSLEADQYVAQPLPSAHLFAAQVHAQVQRLPAGTRVLRLDVDNHGRVRLVTEPPA